MHTSVCHNPNAVQAEMGDPLDLLVSQSNLISKLQANERAFLKNQGAWNLRNNKVDSHPQE